MQEKDRQPINIDTHYLKVDDRDLEQQISRAAGVLLFISRNYNFSTFAHFGKLVELVNSSGGDPNNAKKLLENWDYSSSDFINKTGYGNCVDFAVLAQKMLQDVGVQTSIIGAFPDPEGYSERQINFFRYRHTSLLYANRSEKLRTFMFEPGWKFPKPIVVDQGIVSGNQDWDFETINTTDFTFTQKTFNKNKNKYGERTFDVRELSVESCTSLTKNLTRIPRKLEILNKMKDGIPTYLVRFDPSKGTFVSNIPGIEGEFIPHGLKETQRNLLESSLEFPGLVDYLNGIFKLHISLSQDFWVVGEK